MMYVNPGKWCIDVMVLNGRVSIEIQMPAPFTNDRDFWAGFLPMFKMHLDRILESRRVEGTYEEER